MPDSETAADDQGAAGSSGTILSIDLGGIADNYRTLRDRAAPAKCAAVVKADAYGLGVAKVAPVLARAGCRTFFVAHPDEGVALRGLLPDADIFVLNGVVPGAEPLLAEYRLAPVLNDLAAVDAWAAKGRRGQPLPAALHLDTGMSRLGLTPVEVEHLAREPDRLERIDLRLVMSHLACAEEAENPMNDDQLAEFERARKPLPVAPASLANSSGIFLGPRFHLDLVRPGAALYGVNPQPGRSNPMAQVISLQGRILQLRDVDSPRTVGYGATHRIERPSRVATVALGYADGYLRSLSGRGRCFIAGKNVPVVGRVSMDLITLDVSDLAPDEARPGAVVEIIGDHNPIDAVAEQAGTIAYEILPGLRHRYRRRYIGGDT